MAIQVGAGSGYAWIRPRCLCVCSLIGHVRRILPPYYTASCRSTCVYCRPHSMGCTECGQRQSDVCGKRAGSQQPFSFSRCRRSPALRRHDGDKSSSTRASCRRRPRPCLMSRQRSAPSARLAQLAELTSGRRQACELADADLFSTFCNCKCTNDSHNEPLGCFLRRAKTSATH